MKNPYVKLSLILPKNKPISAIKKFPVIEGFKPKNIEIFVQPSKNEKFHLVDVFLIQ